tara:strand:- start:4354 stop:5634 length:1281 start_codon:yes stop_codon:yes gene_type:complete
MVLFFIRRYNDVDHIAPVVYKLALNEKSKIFIICLNPDISIFDDYRLIFLIKKFNININYIFLIDSLHYSKRLVGKIICNKNMRVNTVLSKMTNQVFWVISLFFRKIVGQKSYYEFIDNFINQKSIENLLDYFEPRLIVFDWIKKSQHKAELIITVCKQRKIPIIALPHGINLMTSKFHTNYEEQSEKVLLEKNKFNDFDFFVVSNELEKSTRLYRGLEENKLKVLGSARFSKEWVKINNSIIPKYLHKNNDRDPRLKVVFMEHSSHYRANDYEIKESINKISKLKYINLVVKAHTRSNRFFNNFDNVNLANSSITSTELVMWADAVIVTMSSIALEPLLQNKVLLYPEYFHRNTTLWGDYGSCWKINSLSELVDALLLLRKKPTLKPYKKDTVNKFLDEAIYNGKSNNDILQNYVNFIQQIKRHQ